MDLTAIDFPDIRWRYEVFYCIRTGTGRDKKYCPWSGVETALGEIEQKTWCQIAEALIDRKEESSLLKCLVEWKTEHNYLHASKEEIRKEALQMHVARLFDNPLWADYVPFNRKYRPDALKAAHLVTVINECCKKPGEVTQEQIDHALNGTIACPCCGRWSPFHCYEEQMENETGMEMVTQ